MSEQNFSSPDSLFPGEVAHESVRVQIVGLGGAGTNAVDRLQLGDLRQVRLAAVNTDQKALNASPVAEKILLGRSVTRGLGAGGEADLGRQAAEADRARLEKLVEGVDLLFLIGGLGGGTASGAAPVLADLAREKGALVLAFVTMPFTFEGARRKQQAEEALTALRATAHAVVPLPNDLLLQQGEDEASFLDAFGVADSWIARGVEALWSLVHETGLINVDFASLRATLKPGGGGKTLFSIGRGEGENPIEAAFEELTLCPLLYSPGHTRRADRLVVHVRGGPDLSLASVNRLMGRIGEQFGGRENTTLGAVIDEDFHGRVEICLLGTTDVNARPGSYTRPTAAHGGAKTPERREEKPAAKSAPSVHQSKLGGKSVSAPQSQEEFSFQQEADERGFFETSERNEYDGEDLDVPTYLRRGIKVVL